MKPGPLPAVRGPAPSGRARTGRGARGGRAQGKPAPGAPRRLRRAGPGPRGGPGAVAGRAARLGEEAAACAQSSAQGRCLPPASARLWRCGGVGLPPPVPARISQGRVSSSPAFPRLPTAVSKSAAIHARLSPD